MALLAPTMAFAVAVGLSSLVLLLAGHDPITAFTAMYDFGIQASNLVNILNKSAAYYLSALAVAIGFRMNLFNIGVDGQYRLAAMCAAVVGASVTLPRPLHIALIVGVGVVVGALWAGIAGAAQGLPRGQRGDLDDHAQLHRRCSGRLDAHPRGVRQAGGEHRADAADRGVGLVPRFRHLRR